MGLPLNIDLCWTPGMVHLRFLCHCTGEHICDVAHDVYYIYHHSRHGIKPCTRCQMGYVLSRFMLRIIVRKRRFMLLLYTHLISMVNEWCGDGVVVRVPAAYLDICAPGQIYPLIQFRPDAT